MARPVGTRIAAVSISRLFGIPNNLEMSFVPVRSERPVSAIIFGENGSGKSSIAKAIEWGTQNRVNRWPVNKRTSHIRLLNVSRTRSFEGSVTVTLSDGTRLHRKAVWIHIRR
jgi:hypothetical protein